MSACSRCGTVAKATDKFCNVCGTPLRAHRRVERAAGARAPQYAPDAPAGRRGRVGYAQTQAPPRSPGTASESIARCQMGHEIAPGRELLRPGTPDRARSDAVLERALYGGGPPQGYGQPGAPGGAPGFGGPPAHSPSGGYGAPPPQGQYGAAPPYATPGAPQPPYSPPGSPFGGQPHQPYGATPSAAASMLRPATVRRPRPRTALRRRPRRRRTTPPETPRPPRILRGFLVAYDANPSGDFWPLTGGRLVVGRLGAGRGHRHLACRPPPSRRGTRRWSSTPRAGRSRSRTPARPTERS